MKRAIWAALLVLLIPICNALAPRTGSKTCPSSGNVAVSSTSIPTVSYILQAPVSPTANTGTVCFGGNNVTTTNGTCLLPGQAYATPVFTTSTTFDLSQVYIACTVTSDTVKYLYY